MSYVELAKRVIRQVNQVVVGKETEVEEIMTAFLANGSVLLDSLPGVGKTAVAMAFSKALGLDYNHIRLSPDVTPSDLTGVSIRSADGKAFDFLPGKLFCNLLLANEINHCSPKTQNTLLDAIKEKQFTMQSETLSLPNPFFAIAAQCFSGDFGREHLTDAQADHFMVSMSFGYPNFIQESEIAKSNGIESISEQIQKLNPVIDKETLLRMQREVDNVSLKEEILNYIIEIVRTTRGYRFIKHGASPRATVAFVKTAKASAWLDGRDYVTPSDVLRQYSYVLWHRITLTDAAKTHRPQKGTILAEIAKLIPKPPVEEESE